jgi:hypothetical protein
MRETVDDDDPHGQGCLWAGLVWIVPLALACAAWWAIKHF